jgi:membrane protease YdiL (CAAX protease family)
VVLVWLLRSGSLAGSAVGQRRQLRGRKWYDAPQLLLSTPWHLVAAIPGSLLLVLWSIGIAAAVGLLCYAAAVSLPVGLGVVGVGFALGLWWGPGSSRLRGPVSRVAHPAAARSVPWLLVLLVLAAVATGLATLAFGGAEWFPADGRPLEGVDVPEIPGVTG